VRLKGNAKAVSSGKVVKWPMVQSAHFAAEGQTRITRNKIPEIKYRK
jgi:hypothetical protein